MTRSLLLRWIQVALALATVAAAFWWLHRLASDPPLSQTPSAPSSKAIPLPLGSSVTSQLAGGAVHTYTVTIPAGRLLHLVADQRGVDIVLSVRRPAGERLVEVDSPNRSWGPEELWWMAPEEGVWWLEVRPWNPTLTGSYHLRDVEVSPASPQDLLRVRAIQAIGRATRRPGDVPAASRELTAARELWRRSGESVQEALTEMRLAEAKLALGDARGGAASYGAALGLFRRLGDKRQEIFTLLRLGESLRLAGDFDGAWRSQAEALRLAQSLGSIDDEASALNNQALILEARGENRAALVRYRRALTLSERLGNRGEVAMALHNYGTCSSLLGLLDQAEAALVKALALRRALGDVRGQGATLTELGWVYRLRALEGDDANARARARELLEQAVSCRRTAHDLAGEAGTLDRLGTVHRDAGDWQEAFACYARSLDLSGSPPGRDRAHTLNNMAELWLERDKPGAARRSAASALTQFEALAVQDRHGEAQSHYLLGRAAARLGDANNARLELERALSFIEELRAGLGDQSLTLPFFALRQRYFEGAIEALMDLEAIYPGRGFSAAALETSERARMRTLLDSLAERRSRDQGAKEWDLVQPIAVGQIRELLDDDTVLLEISLGEERGFLWVVDRSGLSTYPLPGRRALEPLVRETHRNLSQPGGDPAAPRRLVRLLLSPAAGRLHGRRLALVTDGLLAYVPFAALPWGPDGRPLVERFEIVRLPSATTLAALRRRATSRTPLTRKAVVLADPVFSPRDRRVKRTGFVPETPEPADRVELTRSVRDLGLGGLPRLPATRREAEAIAALAPGSFIALDFSATRDLLHSTAVKDARILHLATHGLLNSRDPALSGIVLSLVDEEGRPHEGFLRVEEIAGLELSAEIVVVSACKTALGPEVRGEGLLGLARAFLRAGAASALVSLWSIEDRSSAALMERFYVGFLREGLPPSAALRQAQLTVRSNPDWTDPSYWAGFELQGDWR